MKTMKKNIYQWFTPLLFFALVLLGSCDEYLDVEPKGVQLLTKVEDYDQWLNCEKLQKSLPNEIMWLADNIDDPDISNPVESSSERIYIWDSQFTEDLRSTPILWATHYENIYYFNTVLDGIDGASGGTEEEKASIKAEALLGRAFEYLYLVNLYGKVYDASTASEDLAVPFVTSNDLNTPTPNRSTVQEIYDYIIEDITTAIPNLPEENSENRFRGSVAAAYSVLARTYLYMGNYTEAANNAQLALDNGPNGILDYSTMSSAADISHLKIRSDAIYARLNETWTFTRYPQLSFLQSYDPTDLRLNFFYRNLGDFSFTTRDETYYVSYSSSGNTCWPNWGPSVAEMRLIIAEAAARSNNLTTAIDQLDLLRSKRFLAADYVKFESSVQEDVLQKVLQERTFEFAFTGMRWFDMRRLDAEGRMGTINRYDGEETLIGTLLPGSDRYTLQIPLQVMYFNPDWTQNP